MRCDVRQGRVPSGMSSSANTEKVPPGQDNKAIFAESTLNSWLKASVRMIRRRVYRPTRYRIPNVTLEGIYVMIWP